MGWLTADIVERSPAICLPESWPISAALERRARTEMQWDAGLAYDRADYLVTYYSARPTPALRERLPSGPLSSREFASHIGLSAFEKVQFVAAVGDRPLWFCARGLATAERAFAQSVVNEALRRPEWRSAAWMIIEARDDMEVPDDVKITEAGEDFWIVASALARARIRPAELKRHVEFFFANEPARALRGMETHPSFPATATSITNAGVAGIPGSGGMFSSELTPAEFARVLEAQPRGRQRDVRAELRAIVAMTDRWAALSPRVIPVVN